MSFLEKCGDALGLESGEIKNKQLSSSSTWMGISTFGPQHARLNNSKWPQGWSADTTDQNPWFKVTFQSDYVITGIATQGYGNPVFNEWIESYYLLWLDSKAGEVYYHEDGKVKVGDRMTLYRWWFFFHIFYIWFTTRDMYQQKEVPLCLRYTTSLHTVNGSTSNFDETPARFTCRIL